MARNEKRRLIPPKRNGRRAFAWRLVGGRIVTRLEDVHDGTGDLFEQIPGLA
ncbi:MAG: hypothetical protein JWO99_406 [Candidatus Saccharibacteria bacterium]|nr:hypothetical protein [Candidatus Saccharibacteria bacterium]